MIKRICFFVLAGMLVSLSVIPEEEDVSPQQKAEENVERYIRDKFGAEVSYKLYNFGQIYRLKKTEHRQLDELKELRALVPGMKDHYGTKTDSVLASYDTLIARKEREIKQKNIAFDYIISHVFTIKKKEGNGIVYEGDFILDDKFKVKDLRIKLAAELPKDDFEWFYYFFQKYPVFSTGDYEKDLALSNNLYEYYNARLAVLKSNKEEFLLTALRVSRIVYKTKKYDKDIIGGFIVMKKIDQEGRYPNYKPLKFTPTDELKIQANGKDSLIGYKVMHKFEYTGNDGKTTVKAIYAELDAYFQPAGFLDIPEPFDKYFEDKK